MVTTQQEKKNGNDREKVQAREKVAWFGNEPPTQSRSLEGFSAEMLDLSLKLCPKQSPMGSSMPLLIESNLAASQHPNGSDRPTGSTSRNMQG